MVRLVRIAQSVTATGWIFHCLIPSSSKRFIYLLSRTAWLSESLGTRGSFPSGEVAGA
jgi:hypothetical protein